jgi:hypothetical protein
MSKDNSKFAFPVPRSDAPNGEVYFYPEGGMSLREYFAIRLAVKLMDRHGEPGYADDDAMHEAYRLAEVMIAAATPAEQENPHAG